MAPRQDVLDQVRRYWGFDSLRPMQAEAIAAGLDGRDSLVVMPTGARAENGYDLWLRYHPIADAAQLSEYRSALSELVIDAASPTLTAARAELTRGLSGLLDRELRLAAAPTQAGALIVGTPAGSPLSDASCASSASR